MKKFHFIITLTINSQLGKRRKELMYIKHYKVKTFSESLLEQLKEKSN